MKLLVVGAGALGSLVGGILSMDNEVTILGRPDQVNVINSRGITIEGHTQGKYFPKAVDTPPGDERFDLIVLCVKSYNTGIALESISHLFRPGTYVLSLQNGLDNEEAISRYIRERSIGAVLFGGITCHGVTYKEPGLVKHAGVGDTMIGLYESPPGVDALDGLTGIAEAFKHAGIQMNVVDSIEREIWAKALINSAINPLTAIRGEPNGIILSDPNIKDLARAVVKEGVSVASSHNIPLTEDEILSRTFRTAERTRGNISSMLQDIKRRRRTEIESINGAIIRKAEEKGMDAPCNRTLYRLVRSLEDSYLRPENKNP
ncbi:MAG: ketopantoate reductase family protein [Candidatus Thermoplasmatota archaeon]|nr:ketopantoate reductase family protein [Candidatus Thermoplasmatota archaeon]